MQPSISRLAALVFLLTSRVAAGAQQPAGSVPPMQPSYFQAVLIDVSYAEPVRSNAGASLFLSHDNSSEGRTGFIVGGSIGAGGMKGWAGPAVVYPLGGDFRAVVTRTWSHPSGGPPTLRIWVESGAGAERACGSASVTGNVLPGLRGTAAICSRAASGWRSLGFADRKPNNPFSTMQWLLNGRTRRRVRKSSDSTRLSRAVGRLF